MHNVQRCFLSLALSAFGCCLWAESQPLNGQWRVTVQGKEHTITLPGSLNQAKIGEEAKESIYGSLTPKYQYVGKAVYSKKITVTPEMLGKDYELFMERVLWKSTAYLDGQKLGDFDSFATPHIYRIPKELLTVGEHTLTVEIDNSRIYKITDKGHAYGDAMQTRWNGMVGEIALRTVPVWNSIKIDAPYPAKSLKISFKSAKACEQYGVQLSQGDNTIVKVNVQPKKNNDGSYSIDIPLEAEKINAWDEFNPTLYQLKVTDGEEVVYEKQIGFRTFTREGNRLFINGNPLFIRGNLDNCHFPLTGYPAMDKEAWVRIMKISKDNGLNMIRFHSWCPPQAAFDAADEVGIYLAPEAGIWIDGWMNGRGFPDVKGLGKGNAEVDAFVQNELARILDCYSQSPSMMAICIGNELGSSDFGILGQWMAKCKQNYPWVLVSASTARQITSADDYIVTHAYPGLGMIRERQHPFTTWDYEDSFRKTKVPTISHEIGQWPVYPDWDEINKYTGLLRPWNLEILRDHSKENGVYRFNKRFFTSSLKTNRLMYKDEIESFMRTPSCVGLHLLGIQDYSGQGEALIGWLDSFYDEKPGLEDQPQVSQFFAPVVGLARFPKYTWEVGEEFNVTFQIRNNGNKVIPAGTEYVWTFDGAPHIKGKLVLDKPIQIGELATVAADLKIVFDEKCANKQLTLKFAGNEWDVWVYPKYEQVKTPSSIVYTDVYEDAVAALKEGKKVLFNAYAAGNKNSTFKSSFRPVYWSTTWFPGQSNTTLGLWVNNQHPALKQFPTEDWQSWQWHHLVNSGKNFIIKDLGDKFEPIVMPIDDFHLNRFGAAIFEVAMGKGRLLVCGYDLSQNRPEAKQLLKSLADYAASSSFKPQQHVTEAWLEKTLAGEKITLPPRPKEFEKAAVYIECAVKLAEKNRDIQWHKRFDRAEMTAGTYEISGLNFRLWSDNDGSYWVGNKLNVVFNNVPQLRGKLLVRFRDPNKVNRTAKGTFEGRPFSIPLHQDKGYYWLEMAVDMEDGLDGKLILNIEQVTGPNVMIDRIIYMPNN